MAWAGFGVMQAVPAVAGYNGLNHLSDVQVHMGKAELKIQMEFSEPFTGNPRPVFFDKSIQIDFPGTYIHPAKKNFSVRDAQISEVLVAQFKPDTVRVRLILAENAKLRPADLQTGKKGNQWSVTIGGKTATAALAPAAAKKAVSAVSAPNNKTHALADGASNSKTKITEGEASNTKAHASKSEVSDDDTLDQLLARISQRKKISPAVAKTEAVPVPAVAQAELVTAASVIEEKTLPAPTLAPEAVKTPAVETATAASTTDIKNLLRETPAKESAVPTVETPSLLASGFKMAYTLCFVLGLMFIVFFAAKKTVLKNSMVGGNNPLVQVLSTGFLGPRRSIALVEVAGEVLVLGIAGDTMTLLSRIRDQEKIEKIKSSRSEGFLGQFLKAKNAQPEEIEETLEPVEGENEKSSEAEPFIKYIKKFAEPVKAKTTVADVTAMIRKNLVKIKTA